MVSSNIVMSALSAVYVVARALYSTQLTCLPPYDPLVFIAASYGMAMMVATVVIAVWHGVGCRGISVIVTAWCAFLVLNRILAAYTSQIYVAYGTPLVVCVIAAQVALWVHIVALYYAYRCYIDMTHTTGDERDQSCGIMVVTLGAAPAVSCGLNTVMLFAGTGVYYIWHHVDPMLWVVVVSAVTLGLYLGRAASNMSRGVRVVCPSPYDATCDAGLTHDI